MNWFIIALLIGIVCYFIFRSKPKPQGNFLPTRSNYEISNELIDNYNRRDAKKPAYYAEIMKEDFKDFSHDFTFSKISDFIQSCREVRKENEDSFQENAGFFARDEEFISDDRRMIFKEKFSNTTAGVISENFRNFAVLNSDSYYSAIGRVDRAAELKLDLEFGTRQALAQKALDEAYEAGLRATSN